MRQREPHSTPSAQMTTAMILAAGEGRRLAPLTDHCPKPMLLIGTQPLIERQVAQLKHAGITDIVINLCHLGEQIEAHFGDGRHFGVKIRYSREDTLLDTGGGIRKALPLLGNDPFVLVNGDIYTDFNFRNLPAGLAGDTLGHLVLKMKPGHREQGDFNVAGDGNNLHVSERGEGYVYCGIAILHPNLFNDSPEGAFSLRDLFFGALPQRKLSAQLTTCDWTDIGTPEEYERVRQGHHESHN